MSHSYLLSNTMSTASQIVCNLQDPPVKTFVYPNSTSLILHGQTILWRNPQMLPALSSFSAAALHRLKCIETRGHVQLAVCSVTIGSSQNGSEDRGGNRPN